MLKSGVVPTCEESWIDLRSTLRQLRNSPGFTLVAIAILALGIGATTAIYTLLDQALLRSLPVRNPDRLVQLNGSGTFDGHSDSDGGDVSELLLLSDVPEPARPEQGLQRYAGGRRRANVGLQWHNQPEVADAELVSGNYFDVLGVKPALGQIAAAFRQPGEERQPGGCFELRLLAAAFWRRSARSEPDRRHQWPSFHDCRRGRARISQCDWRQHAGVFAPMMMKPEVEPGRDDLDNHQSRWLNIIARLQPGMTRAKAQAGIQPLWHSLRADELQKIQNHSARFRVGFLEKSYLTLEDGVPGICAGPRRICACLC